MSGVFCLLLAFALAFGAPGPARAVEYTLKVASLFDDAFSFFARGDVGRGEGELAMPGLEHALDAGDIPSGVLLYDRELTPAWPELARSFGAVPGRVTGQTAAGPGHWQSVRWEGNPGERALWIVRPASSFRRRVRFVALSETSDGLRYHIPYPASLRPRPLRAVEYSLAFLRSGEDGRPLWDPYLAKAVDLTGGVAALVGENPSGADSVYLVVEQPAQPIAFEAVVAWGRSQLEKSDTHGGRGSGIHVR